MHRFYLPPEQARQNTISLSARDSHHALNVLRIRTGEPVVVLDGAGAEVHCEVAAVDRHGASLTVKQRRQIPPLPCKVTLLQAIPKGKAMDTIVQKATELGASRVVPILTERTVIQVDDDAAAHKVEKWEAIAIESIKQCGSTWLTKVETPVTPEAFMQRGEKFDLALIGSLQNDSRHPRGYFQEFCKRFNRQPESVCVWVGPEGDFTPEEITAIKSTGALPITLGPLVLRSDTAAIYCLSVINYELQSPRN